MFRYIFALQRRIRIRCEVDVKFDQNDRFQFKRFENWSDGEPALISHKTEAANACPGVEWYPGEPPVGDHQSNGEIECAVREMKRQHRKMRSQLEQNLRFMLDENDPVLTRIPSASADAIAVHRIGQDGKTSWERETGKKWKMPSYI